MKTLGQIVRAKRQDKNLSMITLADSVGTSQPTISLLENDKKYPSKELIDRIILVLGIDNKEILDIPKDESGNFIPLNEPDIVIYGNKSIEQPKLIRNDIEIKRRRELAGRTILNHKIDLDLVRLRLQLILYPNINNLRDKSEDYYLKELSSNEYYVKEGFKRFLSKYEHELINYIKAVEEEEIKKSLSSLTKEQLAKMFNLSIDQVEHLDSLWDDDE